MSIDTPRPTNDGTPSSAGLNCLSALMSIDTAKSDGTPVAIFNESQLPFGLDVG